MKGFALSLVSKVKVYGTRGKLPIVVKSLVATAQASPWGGGGEGEGVFHTSFQTRPLKPYPFSDLAFRQKLCYHYLN